VSRMTKTFIVLFLILSVGLNSFGMKKGVSKQNLFKEVPEEIVINILEFLCFSPETLLRVLRVDKAFFLAGWKIIRNETRSYRFFDELCICEDFIKLETRGELASGINRFLLSLEFGIKLKKLIFFNTKIKEENFYMIVGVCKCLSSIDVVKSSFYDKDGELIVDELSEVFSGVVPESLGSAKIDLEDFSQCEKVFKGLNSRGNIVELEVFIYESLKDKFLDFLNMLSMGKLKSLKINFCSNEATFLFFPETKENFFKDLKFFGLSGLFTYDYFFFLRNIPENLEMLFCSSFLLDSLPEEYCFEGKYLRAIELDCSLQAEGSAGRINCLNNLKMCVPKNVERLVVKLSACNYTMSDKQKVILRHLEDILSDENFTNLREIKIVYVNPEISRSRYDFSEKNLCFSDFEALRSKFRDVTIAFELRVRG